ncbi:MAG: YabP/YqfC family sporulation protein [Clostridia bacterium]|nr:YabP/YqfC family sporulation protein [Clostridia bacterium]
MEDRKNQKDQQKCNILLEDRNRLSVSGVEDIDTFDESEFVAITCAGALVVKGADLHISKLNVDTGELVVDGEFDSCVFNNSYGGKAGGMLARIFK